MERMSVRRVVLSALGGVAPRFLGEGDQSRRFAVRLGATDRTQADDGQQAEQDERQLAPLLGAPHLRAGLAHGVQLLESSVLTYLLNHKNYDMTII
jgi:hypothetical protein